VAGQAVAGEEVAVSADLAAAAVVVVAPAAVGSDPVPRHAHTYSNNFNKKAPKMCLTFWGHITIRGLLFEDVIDRLVYLFSAANLALMYSA
jgi:hypothetical protein